ncbi:MAG: family 43 glycosylhydrolase [Chitinispirillaceae bacterium]|nr:family 43 glycosylhydrolase [Chitinispirillaceae bacterium]
MKSIRQLTWLTMVSAGIVCLLAGTTVILADNPICQTNYTADPAPMVYNDCVYLFTSHDDDVTEDDFYTMRNYCGFSSTDMVNWTHYGIVATLNEFKWLNGHNNGAWAPQCVERDGKFYLYIPIQGKGIGVLAADSPMGPFKDPIGKALINRGNWSDIDPTVFIDDDGQAYMYWGNGTLWYVKLNENMTSYSGSIVTANPKPSNYTEGPWFYKRGDLYYMGYAGMGGGNENLQHATSNSPTGPWTNKGTVMQSGNCFTNHPGICDFKGNSYLFYHNANLPGGGTFKRSVCIEQFTYKSDGTIPTISQTKEGPAQVGSLNPYDTIQAETICWEQGVEMETCSEGGVQVGSIENGDYIKVKGVDFGTNATTFTARVASESSGGKIELHLDSQNGSLIGTCDVKGTGGWDKWETISCAITGASGKKDLYLKFTGGNGKLFNFNWWKFDSPNGLQGAVSRNALTGSMVKTVMRGGGVSSLVLEFSSDDPGRQLQVRLFDLKGRVAATVFDGPLPSVRQIITLGDRENLRRGVYLVQVILENRITTSQQIDL